jgi:hypothetical protein
MRAVIYGVPVKISPARGDSRCGNRDSGDQQLLKKVLRWARLRRMPAPGLPSSGREVDFSRTDGWRRTQAMRTFTIAAVVLAVLAVPVHAQGRRPHAEDKKADQKKPQVDEKAYKAALERIPEPKEKYDPWGVARPAEPAKKPK